MTKRLLVAIALTGALYAQTLTTTAITRYFDVVRANIEEAAEQMPSDRYSYKLTPDQMSFAEWLLHSADRNFSDCAVLRGEAAPLSSKAVHATQGKDAVVKIVKDSFAYCAAVMQTLDDRKVSSTPDIAYAFLHTIVHNNEIYGNMVGYLRTSQLLPPSTARVREAQRKAADKQK